MPLCDGEEGQLPVEADKRNSKFNENMFSKSPLFEIFPFGKPKTFNPTRKGSEKSPPLDFYLSILLFGGCSEVLLSLEDHLMLR